MQVATDRMLFALPEFMAANLKKSDSKRPRNLHVSKSFTRADPPPPDRLTRNQRASTIPNGVIPEGAMADLSFQGKRRSGERTDAFEKSSEDEEENEAADEMEGKATEEEEELPVELASLCDRFAYSSFTCLQLLIYSSFIDSLSAKVHPTPPTVDKLSGLFQNFYAVAATHISTHISMLSSRQYRTSSPAPSISSLSSTASKIRAKAVSISSKERPKFPIERRDSEQQMLTADEIAERKKARKALEHKRVALEEAVERRVCEKIYDRIWRHRSTQDEAQDEKLRSKTAALSVVGIGLTDLGIDLGKSSGMIVPDDLEHYADF